MSLDDLEIWKPVVGWEGCYEVSSVGNLRSLRAVGGTRSDPRAYRLQSHGQYYISAVLKDKAGGKKPTKVYLHRLVAEAFIGPCPAGCECDHIDGNGYNNTVGNLRWLPPRDNYARRSNTGGRACGPLSTKGRHGGKSTTTPEQWKKYEALKRKREEAQRGSNISCS